MTEIEVRGLTKTFGPVTAVRDMSFTAPAGQVTGFLGPNGSGKTTTLRAALGLIRPTAGEALIGGVPYRHLAQPRRRVGALLETSGFHPGRRARNHLAVLAASCGVPGRRVDEVLGLVDLASAADRRVRPGTGVSVPAADRRAGLTDGQPEGVGLPPASARPCPRL